MNHPFTAASHHDILVLLVQVAVLLLMARVLGELMQRLGQPAVLGEILAGMVLGPSLLSGLVPVLGVWLVPQTAVQGYLLELVALIGAMFMLLITGLEIDISLIRRHARTALGTAAGGLIIPFAAGVALAQMLPAELLTEPQQRTLFTLFLATTMSVSAIPVIAKVLIDLKALRHDVGQIIMAAAMIDDITAWTLLSIVVGVAAGAALTVWSVAQAIISVAAFVVVSFTAGRWLVQRVLTFVQNESRSRDAVLSVMMILVFIWGAVSQALHLEAVIGAFVMGILFGQMPNLPGEVVHRLESMALGIFAPIFFAVAGLKVNIASLLEPHLLGFALLFIGVACVSKVSGAYIGARLVGKRDHWTALSFGAALNARGAVGIIIATIGLSLGSLTQEVFSMIVLMSMVTSLVAPLGLRWAFTHMHMDKQELERVRRAELIDEVSRIKANRVLVPMRLRDERSDAIPVIETRLLSHLGPSKQRTITLLTVADAVEKARAVGFLNRLVPCFVPTRVTTRVLTGVSPAEAILEEARKGYDLLVLGAPREGNRSDVLFTPLVDYLVRFAPCPTMVVHGDHVPTEWALRRILVPTSGSLAARRAAAVAFALAPTNSGCVHILSVVEETTQTSLLDMSGEFQQRQMDIARHIVDELCSLGESLGVETTPEVRIGSNPEQGILEVARESRTDLIILGIQVRTGRRLYLGPRVERILNHAPCPVMVVNVP